MQNVNNFLDINPKPCILSSMTRSNVILRVIDKKSNCVHAVVPLFNPFCPVEIPQNCFTEKQWTEMKIYDSFEASASILDMGMSDFQIISKI